MPPPLTVTGTPGIGVTWFSYYLLARLVNSTAPPPFIVWEHMTKPGMAVRLLALDFFRNPRLGRLGGIASSQALVQPRHLALLGSLRGGSRQIIRVLRT